MCISLMKKLLARTENKKKNQNKNNQTTYYTIRVQEKRSKKKRNKPNKIKNELRLLQDKMLDVQIPYT